MAKKESKIEKFIENSKSIRERNRNISNEDIERINKISEEARQEEGNEDEYINPLVASGFKSIEPTQDSRELRG